MDQGTGQSKRLARLAPLTLDLGTVKMISNALLIMNRSFRAFRFAQDFPAFWDRDLKLLGTMTYALTQPPHPRRLQAGKPQGQSGGTVTNDPAFPRFEFLSFYPVTGNFCS